MTRCLFRTSTPVFPPTGSLMHIPDFHYVFGIQSENTAQCDVNFLSGGILIHSVERLQYHFSNLLKGILALFELIFCE